jgi:Flp pilus assembly pilin Flp
MTTFLKDENGNAIMEFSLVLAILAMIAISAFQVMAATASTTENAQASRFSSAFVTFDCVGCPVDLPGPPKVYGSPIPGFR